VIAPEQEKEEKRVYTLRRRCSGKSQVFGISLSIMAGPGAGTQVRGTRQIYGWQVLMAGVAQASGTVVRYAVYFYKLKEVREKGLK